MGENLTGMNPTTSV